MLIQVYLLLLSSVGIYAYYSYDHESQTEDELFSQLDFVFPSNFVSKYPDVGEFFSLKVIAYLFFNLFAKYFGEKEPAKFWSKFNQNDFNRVALDAVFYEYLTKFADKKRKHRIFNPLKSSANIPEDVAIDRIGLYIDNLAGDQMPVDQSETSESPTTTTETEDDEAKSTEMSTQVPTSGIPGKDFPNYCDIPQTSFSCSDKIIPGVYADLETGCQVFHVCWPRRIDSFLCPIGTTFNQALLTCDFWHESDCSSSPNLFDSSDLTAITTDETLTTSERPPSAFTPGPDCQDYDENCESLLSKPLQLRMKFVPAKCQVTHLKSIKPKAPNKDKKHFSRFIADSLSKTLQNLFEFINRANKLGRSGIPRIRAPVQPKVEKKWKSKSRSKNLKAVTESTSTYGKIDTTSEEQMHPSTTDLPSWVDSGIAEKTVIKEKSHETEKHIRSVTRSTLIKPSKPSEASKKHAFDIMVGAMELGSSVMNDSILPFIETMVLDGHQKMPKSKKI